MVLGWMVLWWMVESRDSVRIVSVVIDGSGVWWMALEGNG